MWVSFAEQLAQTSPHEDLFCHLMLQKSNIIISMTGKYDANIRAGGPEALVILGRFSADCPPDSARGRLFDCPPSPPLSLSSSSAMSSSSLPPPPPPPFCSYTVKPLEASVLPSNAWRKVQRAGAAALAAVRQLSTVWGCWFGSARRDLLLSQNWLV